MNREEAKFVLRSYPVNGQNSDDPQFKEALLMAQQDPELRDWFADERAVDTLIAKKVQTIAPPAELQQQIFASQKVLRVPAWRFTIAWGAAAAVIMILALTAPWLRSPAHPTLALDDFQTFVVRAATTLDHLEVNTNNLTVIRGRLAMGGAPSDFALPEGLSEMERVGCRVFDWQGRRVSLICFGLGEQKVAHLFVVDSSALPKTPDNRHVKVDGSGDGIATALWADERYTYVVALRDGQADLERIFL